MATKKAASKKAPPPPTEAYTKGEFTVPEDKQQPLKDLDARSGQIQKELGRLEVQYAQRKAQILGAYQQNLEAYEKAVKAVAKDAGVDLDTLQESWTFDLATMQFKRQQN